MILLRAFKLEIFPTQNVEKGALLMGQVLAVVRSLSLLQLQHLFVVEKRHLFFISVVFQVRLCQCFS